MSSDVPIRLNTELTTFVIDLPTIVRVFEVLPVPEPLVLLIVKLG